MCPHCGMLSASCTMATYNFSYHQISLDKMLRYVSVQSSTVSGLLGNIKYFRSAEASKGRGIADSPATATSGTEGKADAWVPSYGGQKG